MRSIKILSIGLVLLALSAIAPARVEAQTLYAYQNWCQIGGRQVMTSGLPSANLVQQSYPNCNVTVFMAGTSNKASIFSDDSGTVLPNPFTALTDASFRFFAQGNVNYDITISGAGMPAPKTFTNICIACGPTSGGTGNVNPASTPLPCTYYASIGNTVSPNPQCKIDNLGNLTTPAVNRVYSVDGYGAAGNGKMCPSNADTCSYSGGDDTVPIQSAINAACSAGGGTVQFAGGRTYNIIVTTAAPRLGGDGIPHGITAIYIPCSNITLTSYGVGTAALSLWMRNNGTIERETDECVLNPDSTNPPQTPKIFRVFRGSAIFLNGTTDPNNPQHDVTIENLRITGNSYINTSNKNPVWYDNQIPTVKQSICNAWDTSQKGIFFNNAIWTFASFDQSTGYYNGFAYAFDSIHILNVEVDHFMGELIYAGSQIPHIEIRGNKLHDSNGDGESVGGGVDSEENEMYNLAASGVEDTPGAYAMTYKLNRLHNIKLDGIAVVNIFQPTLQNPKYGNFTVTENWLDTIGRTGIHGFNAVNMSVSNNSIKDTGWNPNGFGAGIELYNFGNSHPAAWGPAAPGAAPNVVAGASGGFLTGGSYRTGIAWAFGQSAAVGITAVSAVTSTTAVANGTLVITQPAAPPANATGWLPFICNGASCTLRLQNFSSPLPLSTTTFIQTTEPLTNTFVASATPIVMDPNATATNVVNNNCTADAGSPFNCFTLTSQGFPMVAPYISSSTFKTNTFSNALHNVYAPVAAPASAPTITAVVSPGFGTLAAGTYYVTTALVSPACLSNKSSESSITISAGQMIRVSPPTTSDPNVIGYQIGIGTVSGTEYTQFINNYQSLALPYDQSTAITTNQVMTNSNCTGVTLSHGFQFNLLSQAGQAFALQAPGFVEENNEVNNSLVQFTNQRQIASYLLPTTSAYVGLAQIRPWRPRSYRVSIHFAVITAPTTVSISVTWTDSNGTARTQQVATGDLYPVGSQNFNDFTIDSGTAISVNVNFQAGTANQVYASAAILDN